MIFPEVTCGGFSFKSSLPEIQSLSDRIKVRIDIKTPVWLFLTIQKELIKNYQNHGILFNHKRISTLHAYYMPGLRGLQSAKTRKYAFLSYLLKKITVGLLKEKKLRTRMSYRWVRGLMYYGIVVLYLQLVKSNGMKFALLSLFIMFVIRPLYSDLNIITIV